MTTENITDQIAEMGATVTKATAAIEAAHEVAAAADAFAGFVITQDSTFNGVLAKRLKGAIVAFDKARGAV